MPSDIPQKPNTPVEPPIAPPIAPDRPDGSFILTQPDGTKIVVDSEGKVLKTIGKDDVPLTMDSRYYLLSLFKQYIVDKKEGTTWKCINNGYKFYNSNANGDMEELVRFDYSFTLVDNPKIVFNLKGVTVRNPSTTILGDSESRLDGRYVFHVYVNGVKNNINLNRLNSNRVEMDLLVYGFLDAVEYAISGVRYRYPVVNLEEIFLNWYKRLDLYDSKEVNLSELKKQIELLTKEIEELKKKIPEPSQPGKNYDNEISTLTAKCNNLWARYEEVRVAAEKAQQGVDTINYNTKNVDFAKLANISTEITSVQDDVRRVKSLVDNVKNEMAAFKASINTETITTLRNAVNENTTKISTLSSKVESIDTNAILNQANTNVTKALESYVKTADISKAMSTTLEPYATKVYVDDKISKAGLGGANLDEYVKKTDLNLKLTNYPTSNYLQTVLQGYPSAEQIDNKLKLYIKSIDADTKITEATKSLATKAELEEGLKKVKETAANALTSAMSSVVNKSTLTNTIKETLKVGSVESSVGNTICIRKQFQKKAGAEWWNDKREDYDNKYWDTVHLNMHARGEGFKPSFLVMTHRKDGKPVTKLDYSMTPDGLMVFILADDEAVKKEYDCNVFVIGSVADLHDAVEGMD